MIQKVIVDVEGMKKAIAPIPTFNYRQVIAAIDAFAVDMPDVVERGSIKDALWKASDSNEHGIDFILISDANKVISRAPSWPGKE